MIITLSSKSGSTIDTGRRWHKDGFTYGLFQWKHSRTYMLCVTSLNAVINRRALHKTNRSQIRTDWVSVRNDEIAAELLKEGITLS